MQLIITHENADFDAFASTVAALKLYPDAQISLGRRVSAPLRDFMALHKDRFKQQWLSDIDQEAVTSVILVDVRRASRLKGWEVLIARIMRGEASLHIYDHHAAASDDLIGDVEVIEPVGSATTLLIELIRERDITLDVMEATLLALGIYTDTGALTYASTTARDAEAVAWLLTQGVSLKMVNRYLRSALSAEQREALSVMLGRVEVYSVGGVDVGFVTVPLEKTVNGLSAVTTQVVQLEGHAALFAIFPIIKRKRVQVIARSQVPYINVGEILQRVGGGGHAGAGSAVIKKGDPAAIRATLLDALNADPPRPRTVMDVMSSPVHTVGPRTLLAEVRDDLQSRRHTGVPVVDEQGKVVGIVSRRDVRNAETGERLHLPVSSCMSKPVRTTTIDTPLDDAMALMIERDIGRLPVVNAEDRVVGIISRSDILRILYKEQRPEDPPGAK